MGIKQLTHKQKEFLRWMISGGGGYTYGENKMTPIDYIVMWNAAYHESYDTDDRDRLNRVLEKNWDKYKRHVKTTKSKTV